MRGEPLSERAPADDARSGLDSEWVRGAIASMIDPQEVLGFWFGDLDALGRASGERTARWWKKDPAFDALIRERFGALHGALMRGEHDDWLATPRGALAYLIVLDQFSRNMFRDTARAFEGDELALEAALAGIERGQDRSLAFGERAFFYMPLMHSEELAHQERCVELFTAFEREVAPELQGNVHYNVTFAERHRDIVQRFGRFPHRNSALGRTSTAEEIEFLREPGSSF
jgi:uncharacterized protein (DUF924 family)